LRYSTELDRHAGTRDTELDRHAGTRDTEQSLIDMLALEIQYRA